MILLLEVTISLGAAFIAFILSIAALFYNYGGQMIKDRFAESHQLPKDITSDKVSNYFKEQGYIVRHISPTSTNKWTAFLFKDGKHFVVTVLTERDKIIGHDYSLV